MCYRAEFTTDFSLRKCLGPHPEGVISGGKEDSYQAISFYKKVPNKDPEDISEDIYCVAPVYLGSLFPVINTTLIFQEVLRASELR